MAMRNSIKIPAICFSLILSLSTSWSCDPIKAENPCKDQIVLSVNAYSFADLLSAKDSKNQEQVYTLFNLLDWCAGNNIKAMDPTGYFFPTYPEAPSDEYIALLKARADELGVAFSGTGIRNNFASPDSTVRAQGVELAKKWIVVASKLGAPVLRLFAGEIPAGYEDKWDEVAGWMVECYKECAVYGEQYGVKIGIQNHGDMLQTADQCLKVLNAVDSKWVGLIVDTGSFRTADPYADIEAVTPYAINWQVKDSPFSPDSEVRTDYNRLIEILYRKGYHGYLPVETLMVKGQPYDPFAQATDMLSKLDAAMEAHCNSME